MSEPIEWSGDGRAVVDGVALAFEMNNSRGEVSVWSTGDERVSVSFTPSLEPAARAVVAAVKVLRGER